MFILQKKFRRNHWKSIATLDNSMNMVCFILLQLFAYIFLLKKKFRKISLSFMKHFDVMRLWQHFCIAPEHRILSGKKKNPKPQKNGICFAQFSSLTVNYHWFPWSSALRKSREPKGVGWVGFFPPKNTDRKEQEIVCVNLFSLCFLTAPWNPGKTLLAKHHLIPSWDPTDNFYIISLERMWKWKKAAQHSAQSATSTTRPSAKRRHFKHAEFVPLANSSSYWKESTSSFANKWSKDKPKNHSLSASSRAPKTAALHRWWGCFSCLAQRVG